MTAHAEEPSLASVIAASPAVPTGQLVHVVVGLDTTTALEPGDLAIMQDATEVTVVTSSSERLAAARARGAGIEGPFAVIRLEISLSFAAPGFVAAATTACATAGVNVFVLSTYSYDYVLVPEPDLPVAMGALADAGFPTAGSDERPPSSSTGTVEGAAPPEDGSPVAIAQAFSGHRFAAAYPHLATDVEWVLVGGSTLTGKAAVVDACDATLEELAVTDATFTKFTTISDGDAVVVDAIGEYRAADGSSSSVRSCDLYEFSGSTIIRMTSYTIELSSPSGLPDPGERRSPR